MKSKTTNEDQFCECAKLFDKQLILRFAKNYILEKNGCNVWLCKHS